MWILRLKGVKQQPQRDESTGTRLYLNWSESHACITRLRCPSVKQNDVPFCHGGNKVVNSILMV